MPRHRLFSCGNSTFEPIEKELVVLPKEGIQWIHNTNGASNKEEVGIRVIIKSSSEVIKEEAFRLEK